jgi:2-(1,2-epoxy-1,2-dihydrophenyl)acetyl-CoA isomerase
VGARIANAFSLRPSFARTVDPNVLVANEDGIATITLNKPTTYNAFNVPFIKEIRKAFEDTIRKPDVDAIVFTGAGKAFCAGGDINAMKEALNRDPQRLFEELTEHLHPLVAGIRKWSKPVVAAINGPVAGGGFGFAVACDVRVAAPTASFKPAYSKLGICPDGGITFFLPRLVGFAHAQRIILFDETIDAPRALELGIVDRVVEADRLLPQAKADAAKLAAQPVESFRLTKELLSMSYLGDLDLQLERERRRNAASAKGPWLREGVTAFLEKREPVFRTKRATARPPQNG